MNFAQIGIICYSEPQIQTLIYEAPINISSGNLFCGECYLGVFSYINGSCDFTSVKIGRYCSVASSVIIGPGQHSTTAFSTHPFIYDPSVVLLTLLYI